MLFISFYHLSSLMIVLSAYGKVFLVRRIGGRDHGEYYAMKVLKKERVVSKKKSLEHALMERRILAKLTGCPFLVNLVYAFQSDTKLHIIMGKITFSLNYCQSMSAEVNSSLTCVDDDVFRPRWPDSTWLSLQWR